MDQVKAIQNWWRLLCECRCRKCGDVYSGKWICDECYMDRHEDIIPQNVWTNFEEARKERKHKSQEKKRTLGLIP